eukprot:8084593-Lingulodinium_polyedra.AAC.1
MWVARVLARKKPAASERPFEPLRPPHMEEAGHRKSDGDAPRLRLAVDFGDDENRRFAVVGAAT